MYSPLKEICSSALSVALQQPAEAFSLTGHLSVDVFGYQELLHSREMNMTFLKWVKKRVPLKGMNHKPNQHIK